jgi:branched-chain amino acid transport system substrate-binding protein
MNRRTFLTTAAMSVAPLASAAEKEKVKIVSSLPRVGSDKGITDQMVTAIQMAIADFAKALPFEVVYRDWDDASARRGSWTAELETENAQQAIEDKDVMAFIGPFNSGAARVSAPLLNKAGLVQITPSASWPGLTYKDPTADTDEPEKYRPGKKITFCRVCPNDGSQGPLSADFAIDELKVKAVYVLDNKELHGHGIATGFKKRCQERKVTILGHESINVLQADFQKLMRKVAATKPDLVYFGGTTMTKGGQIAKDMVAEKVGCPLLVPDGCYEQRFIDHAGESTFDTLKCFVTVGGINPASLKGRRADFVKELNKITRKNVNAYAVYAYEAAAVVLEALRAVGKKDREAIRKAVVGTKDFDKGLLGKWSFDANGDTTFQPLTVTTVEGGKFKTVKVMGTK